jgi:hypothetical protein
MGNGELMLLLAHLLVQNSAWRSRPIRLLRVISSEAGREEVVQHLTELIAVSRIGATPLVVVAEDVARVIHEHSDESAVVFLGVTPPGEGDEAGFFQKMERFAGRLERAMFVYSGGGISLDK